MDESGSSTDKVIHEVIMDLDVCNRVVLHVELRQAGVAAPIRTRQIWIRARVRTDHIVADEDVLMGGYCLDVIEL